MIFLVLKSLLLNISGLTNNCTHINSFLHYFGHCDQVTIPFYFLFYFFIKESTADALQNAMGKN